MKIIFNTLSLKMGGAEKLAIEYVKKLAEDFEILLLIRQNNFERNDLELEIPKNVKYHYVIDNNISFKLNKYEKLKSQNFLYKIFYNYYLKKRRKSFQKNIKKILKNEKYDILIDFCFKLPLELYNNKTIIWQQTDINKEKFSSNEFITQFEKKIKKINKLIVLTDTLKQKIKIHLKDEELINKVEVIYNFFDIKNIKRLAENKSILNNKEKMLLSDKFILCCSRLDKNKDLKTAILAFNLIKNQISQKLYIIGEGKEKGKLIKLVKNLNLEKRVIFLGKQRNPYVWMKNADLFLHTSKSEGFGMVLVEALINNCIVVSTDCPVGPREILADGEYGILTEVSNIEDISNNIYRALIDEKFRKKLLEKINKRVQIFSQEQTYEKLKNILIKIGEFQ